MGKCIFYANISLGGIQLQSIHNNNLYRDHNLLKYTTDIILEATISECIP